MALMSYLVRDKLGTYYFRRVIPVDLRPFMPAPWAGKANWKLSLRTKSPAAAKQAAFRVGRDCMADFEAAERARRGEPALSTAHLAVLPKVDEIEREVMSGLLADDEAQRSDGDSRRHLQSTEERAQWTNLVPVPTGRRGVGRDFADAYGSTLRDLHEEYREALGRSDTEIVDAECRRYLREKNIPIDPTSEVYHEVGMAILRAHVAGYGRMLDRQRGDIVPTPKPNEGRGPKLSEAYEAWKAGSGARGSKKPAAKTLLEADRAVRRLTEWHSDIRLADLTREMAVDFRVALASTPTHLPEKLRRLTLRELLKRDLKGYPLAHASTVNKHLNILSAIFNHAEAAGKLDAVPAFRNPFGKSTKVVVDARAEVARSHFTKADLVSIFGTGVFVSGDRPVGGGGEAAFWLPLMALLTGARQGELAHLRIMDLAQDDESGVWHIAIGTAGGGSIKTASSRRQVPVHPELIRIGLLRYRQSLLDEGRALSASLWPGLKIGAEAQPVSNYSKWFNRHLREKAGIEDRTKVFHSFRHTFKRIARTSKVPEDVHDAFTGHAGGGVGRDYGQGFGLKALAEEMAKIEVPEAVKGLGWPPEQS